jgi:signal transduction histidine kinase/CRP-like cAMP-binding protein
VPRIPHPKTQPTRTAHPAPSGAGTSLSRVLTSLALFKDVPQSSLAQLARAMRPRRIAAGSVVFAQGDPAREFFVLAAGRVIVTIKGGDPEGPPIAALSGPTWFGDLAIVSDQPRISTVTAATDCEFWVLPRPRFEAFFNRHPRMARNLAAALVRRLQEKDQDFTSQSTLALERARLLTDLQQGTAELAALADVTRALNASLDLDETLQAISNYAARLTTSDTALIFLYDEGRDVLTVRASYNAPEGYLAEIGERPIPRNAARSREVPSDCSLTVRAVFARRPVQIADMEAAHRYPNRTLLLRWGYRAVLVVPLLHDERVIGAMSVLRARAGEFTAREIELVTTFASHSAIAIEHARLFQEVQAQNRALKEALEHQTVTSEFLKGINRTAFELQPMLETLVEHATDLCGAAGGLIFTLEDGAYRWAADYRTPPAFRRLLQENPIHPGRGGLVDRTAKEGWPVHIPDVLADPEYRLLDAQKAGGYRSVLGIPLLRDGSPIGVITTYRTEVQPFTDKDIERLTSFAEMAVTAIEKIRLFRELQARTEELAESVEELRALSRTTQAVNSSLDLQRVLSAIAEQACKLCHGDAGLITEVEERTGEFRPCASWNVSPRLVQSILAAPPTWGNGATGQSAALRGPVQIPDILAAPGYRWRDLLSREGYRAILSVPLLRDGRAIGTIAVARATAGPFLDRHMHLLTTFANQAAIALEHAHLFEQLQEKAAQLEVVSRHKSEFLASMSHELRTPLNAIIGFSEVLLDPSLSSVTDGEQQEFLTNILTSGKHLLRLINDVLDLSKVEAGKLEIHPEAVSLAEIVEGVLGTLKPLAMSKRIRIVNEIHPHLDPVFADPARLKQILYNLLSNAIKFTPEEGHVGVMAHKVDSSTSREIHASLPIDRPDGLVEVSVTDTGVGIPPADLGRIFEEFEQVEDPTRRSQEGTGLGLALVKKLVEMHGGTIRVASAPGQGSTFTFTLSMAGR